MNTFIFTKKTEKEFLKLPSSVQERIIAKLKELKQHADVFSLLKRLHDFEPATHRLRIGSHRLILGLKNQNTDHVEFWILDLGDRKDIYR